MDPIRDSGFFQSSAQAERWFGALLNLAEAEQFRTDALPINDEILELFRTEVQEAVTELGRAVEDGDWVTIRHHAHNLQGMGGAVGAPEVSLVGLNLSQTAKAGDLPRTSALVQALKGWFADVELPGATPSPTQEKLQQIEGTCLVVDDEEPNRLLLKELLDACGAQVITAGSGLEAVNAVTQHLPDVALIDVNMPGMSGYDLCKQFKETPGLSGISVILVTARTDVEDIERGFELGAFDYIRKPFHSRELLARVGNAIRLKKDSDRIRTWNAHFRKELRMAGILQSALLNPVPVMGGRCDVHTCYTPSQQVGGDFFDVHAEPDGTLRGYVADVAGHGVASALVSTLMKGLFSEAASHPEFTSLADIANRVHTRYRALISDPEFYATGFLFQLDPSTRELRGLNLGHPMPFVLDPDGRTRTELLPDVGGMPIGIWPSGMGVPYQEKDVLQITLPHGAALLVYTDGLIEARDGAGKEVGLEGIEKACSATRGNPAATLARLRADGYQLDQDDCTLMAIRLISEDSVIYEARICMSAEEASSASERLMHALTRHQWEEDTAAMVRLVAMEHLMNLVRHAGIPVGQACECRVTLQPDGEHCTLLFRDPGKAWSPFSRETVRDHSLTEELRESGRGWSILERLCDQTEYFRRDGWNHHVFYLSRHGCSLETLSKNMDPGEPS